jgi:lipoprotein signal peptidase
MERSYRILLWGLALFGLCLDQASKYGVFAWLHDVEKHHYVLFGSEYNGFTLVAGFDQAPDGGLVPHVNHGALFGFLRDYESLANVGFAAVSLLAALAIAYWSRLRSTARDRWLCVALGLILAGTLGNLYDRVLFNGVRDFLHWNYLFDWPVFNLADSCLVAGAGVLLLQAFVSRPASEESASPASVVQSAPPASYASAATGPKV